MCVFSLVELMRWRRTAREPTLLRSLLFSNFWRTNMTSRSGKEIASRGKVEIDRKKFKCVMHELSEKKNKREKQGRQEREVDQLSELIWLSRGGQRVWHANGWFHYRACDSDVVGQRSAVYYFTHLLCNHKLSYICNCLKFFYNVMRQGESNLT